jgi:hypothetical protein
MVLNGHLWLVLCPVAALGTPRADGYWCTQRSLGSLPSGRPTCIGTQWRTAAAPTVNAIRARTHALHSDPHSRTHARTHAHNTPMQTHIHQHVH